MEDKRKTIKVKLPDTVKTRKEIEDYLAREFGFGRIDHADEVPADEDCEAIFEIEIDKGDAE